MCSVEGGEYFSFCNLIGRDFSVFFNKLLFTYQKKKETTLEPENEILEGTCRIQFTSIPPFGTIIVLPLEEFHLVL